MFCTKCGNNNPDGANCCTSCGAPLEQPQAPQQPVYQAPQQPVYNAPFMDQVPSKGLAIAGFVLGIVAIVLGFIPFITLISLPLAIVGLILSIMGGKKLKAAGQPSGIATAGLIIGIISVVISGICFFTCGICATCIACSSEAAYLYY